MTRAPFATAQRIAFASASTGIDRCGPTTFAIRSSAGGARPAMPTPSFVSAAISPATNVPWPWVSTVAGPATKLLAAAIRPRSSGCVPSMPESITATRTAASGGGSVQASKDRFCAAYHWRGRNGSLGTNDVPAAPQRLDVARARDTPERRALGRGDREGGDRREVDDRRRAARPESLRDRGTVGGRRDADREPGRLGGRGGARGRAPRPRRAAAAFAITSAVPPGR